MDNKPTPEELRQYADGELPAELLAEYPVAKKPLLEAPHFINPVEVSIPREVIQQNRRQRRTKVLIIAFWTFWLYVAGYFWLPYMFRNTVCMVWIGGGMILVILDSLSTHRNQFITRTQRAFPFQKTNRLHEITDDKHDFT